MVKIGFIYGKEEDDDNIKYNKAFYKSLKNKYLNGNNVNVDVAIPYYISQKYDVEVDIIGPNDITMNRLKQNDINFLIGYDLVTEFNSDTIRYRKIRKIFESASSKVWPRWKTQNFIYNKGDYAKYLEKKGIPVAPAVQVKKIPKTQKEFETLFKKLKKTDWESIIAKPELSGWSIGIEKIDLQDLSVKRLKKYFKDYRDYPRFIFQQALRGFAKKWEIRLFYLNGKFKYAIGNKAAIATGKDETVTHNPPKKDLDRVIKIGNKIMKLFPKTIIKGKKVEPTMVRMDFGCCLNNSLDSKDYFLNEIENQAANYFAKHVRLDLVPEYSKAFIKTTEQVMGKKIKLQRSKSLRARRSRRKSVKRRTTQRLRFGSEKIVPVGDEMYDGITNMIFDKITGVIESNIREEDFRKGHNRNYELKCGDKKVTINVKYYCSHTELVVSLYEYGNYCNLKPLSWKINNKIINDENKLKEILKKFLKNNFPTEKINELNSCKI